MPRQSRIDAPGALHHIIVRGIEKRTIFRDDGDRDHFLVGAYAAVVVAATVLELLGLDPSDYHPDAGPVLPGVLDRSGSADTR